MSTLGYALLGLLADRPRTGYDIAKGMRSPVGYLWTASHSQIYPALQALHDAGLVSHTIVEGPGPRDNRRYSMTAAGRAALTEWVDSPLRQQPARSELLLRVRTLWTVSPGRARGFLIDVQLDSEHRLASYREIEAQFESEGEQHRDPRTQAFWSYATLLAGIGYEQHLLGWTADLLAQLRRPPPGGGVKAAPDPSSPGRPRPG